jgi:hypothetical protein
MTDVWFSLKLNNLNSYKLIQIKKSKDKDIKNKLKQSFDINSSFCLRIRNARGHLIPTNPQSFDENSRENAYTIELYLPIVNTKTSTCKQSNDENNNQMSLNIVISIFNIFF